MSDADSPVSQETDESTAAPVRRRRRVAPVDPHEVVRVRNTSKAPVHTGSGSVKAGEEGTMKRLDANRMRRFVEIIDG